MHPVSTQMLRPLNLFRHFNQDELAQIASILNPIQVVEGEILMRRGDPAQTFYIVLTGNYMVYIKGGQAFTIDKMGDVMGWSSVVTPFYYRATGVALTHGELLSMSRLDFLRLLRKNSTLSNKIMKEINEVADKRLYFLKKTSIHATDK